jgi:Arc/MetJ-type ribon-helix-helix transcriptional regulator
MSINTLSAEMSDSISVENTAVDSNENVNAVVGIVAHPMIREAIEELVESNDTRFTSQSQAIRVAINDFIKQPLGKVDAESILDIVPVGTDKVNKRVQVYLTPTMKQQLKYVKDSPMTPYSTYFEVGAVAIVWFCATQNSA